VGDEESHPEVEGKIAAETCLYKPLAPDPVCYERVFAADSEVADAHLLRQQSPEAVGVAGHVRPAEPAAPLIREDVRA
jgi:hypothetical protein